jgi:Sigma-70 region 2
MAGMGMSSDLTGDIDVTTTPSVTFESLFADHHARLFRALYLIVGDTYEAEELAQEAFLKVFERWNRIHDPEAYLYRSALNTTRSRFIGSDAITVEGPFYDTKDSTLAITGGTGAYADASGEMECISMFGGTEYGFVFRLDS